MILPAHTTFRSKPKPPKSTLYANIIQLSHYHIITLPPPPAPRARRGREVNTQIHLARPGGWGQKKKVWRTQGQAPTCKMKLAVKNLSPTARYASSTKDLYLGKNRWRRSHARESDGGSIGRGGDRRRERIRVGPRENSRGREGATPSLQPRAITRGPEAAASPPQRWRRGGGALNTSFAMRPARASPRGRAGWERSGGKSSS